VLLTTQSTNSFPQPHVGILNDLILLKISLEITLDATSSAHLS